MFNFDAKVSKYMPQPTENEFIIITKPRMNQKSLSTESI